MNRYERLVLIVVVLFAVSKLGALGRDILLAQTYGAAPIPDGAKQSWEFVSLLIAGAVNIGTGIWLYLEAAQEKLSRAVWTIFGLFFGLIGLAIFYLVQTHAQRKLKQVT